MLFTIRRRSQVSLFLARVGRTCTLDRRVKTKARIRFEKMCLQDPFERPPPLNLIPTSLSECARAAKNAYSFYNGYSSFILN